MEKCPVQAILASTSPRRRELLDAAGLTFMCVASNSDEATDDALPPTEQAIAAAEMKARDVLEALRGDDSHPIIGCDTMVVLDGEIYGKPVDEADARRMLCNLSGRTHQVISGVCILFDGGKLEFEDTTDVTFFELSEADIDGYISTGEPFDKAGAYGIQGGAGKFVERIDGSYDNVVGLPTARVMEALAGLECEPFDKARIRAAAKAARKALGSQKRARLSAAACSRLASLPDFESAKTVAIYSPYGTELSLDALLLGLVESGQADKRIAVPVVIGERAMEFVVVDPADVLSDAAYEALRGEGAKRSERFDFIRKPSDLAKIPEDAQVLDSSEIELIVVPGVSFDPHNNRLGYGGGYYDTYLAREDFKAKRIGIFFDEQMLHGTLPIEDNDIPLPIIVTPSRVQSL